MFGSKYFKLALVLIAVLALATTAFAGPRKLPGRSFRFGLDLEPGFKFINGNGLQFNTGLIFKFNEKISLIPHFGMYPYEYVNKYRFLGTTYSDTTSESALNAGLTLRMEILKEVSTKNTRYEYDTEGEEFVHYRYYQPLRPYFQAHLGTFMGGGMGINYYITGNTAMGLGLDFGYNLLSEDSKGLGIIPKGIVMFGF
ncbi:hypothetical protein HY768_03830 [candidate division TA06 bacterium]|uniref:Outer membrane protein beta-barrel domain-containing protein n=1 Tax=candidate division TA06 bacterium TaxID=2250710 RepID=A0A933I8U1_UNCT6|nr:hypothetical protein [candidate division TA06 bacterium]